ncbi:hypothetical protein L211DRAFT_181826 [Terfezia boudieri ATCC MYA-4762]|uniref:Uncharacterized protein n=1 Tax=Terfezia boudieri ATCC MYA-4762 TaxID=1051890 RepID=A0A3N4LVJ1_9PEZI|nr:hypothetical protein L211DRAFT_181826 [Terfezia boudieri ATCC MYA-4762]
MSQINQPVPDKFVISCLSPPRSPINVASHTRDWLVGPSWTLLAQMLTRGWCPWILQTTNLLFMG